MQAPQGQPPAYSPSENAQPTYAPPPAYAHPPAYTAQPGIAPDPPVITTAPAAAPMYIITQPHSYPMPKHSYIGSKPAVLTCPDCRMDIVTRVESVPSVRTHLLALCLCVFVFWPCTCLPYCIGSCNNAEHFCPNCHNHIGTYKF